MLDNILQIVLSVLAVLGITILVILGLVLIVLLLVMFVPIRYNGELLKDSENIKAYAKISWLLRIVRCRVEYQKDILIRAYVLFFKVYDSSAPAKEKKVRKKKNKGKKEQFSDKQEQSNGDDANDVTLSESEDDIKESEQEEFSNISDNVETAQDDDTIGLGRKQSFFTKLKKKIENIICKCKAICDKLKSIVQNINYYIELLKEEETKVIFGRVFGRLLIVLKSIRPRKFKADIIVGTGAPDTTGYIMAVAGMLYPYLGRHVNITPDFDNTIFEGKIEFKGRITLFVLIIHAIKLYLDKELGNLISRLKREDA